MPWTAPPSRPCVTGTAHWLAIEAGVVAGVPSRQLTSMLAAVDQHALSLGCPTSVTPSQLFVQGVAFIAVLRL